MRNIVSSLDNKAHDDCETRTKGTARWQTIIPPIDERNYEFKASRAEKYFLPSFCRVPEQKIHSPGEKKALSEKLGHDGAKNMLFCRVPSMTTFEC